MPSRPARAVGTRAGVVPSMTCPAGRYRPTGASDNNYQRLVSLRANGCVDCPRGRYGDVAGLTTELCVQDCPKGRYRDIPGAKSEHECSLCPPGRYGDASGLTTKHCSAPCPSGKYSTVRAAAREDRSNSPARPDGVAAAARSTAPSRRRCGASGRGRGAAAPSPRNIRVRPRNIHVVAAASPRLAPPMAPTPRERVQPPTSRVRDARRAQVWGLWDRQDCKDCPTGARFAQCEWEIVGQHFHGTKDHAYPRPRRNLLVRNPMSTVAASTEYPRRGRGAAAKEDLHEL